MTPRLVPLIAVPLALVARALATAASASLAAQGAAASTASPPDPAAIARLEPQIAEPSARLPDHGDDHALGRLRAHGLATTPGSRRATLPITHAPHQEAIMYASAAGDPRPPR